MNLSPEDRKWLTETIRYEIRTALTQQKQARYPGDWGDPIGYSGATYVGDGMWSRDPAAKGGSD